MSFERDEISEAEIAWAAGLFEGEGSICPVNIRTKPTICMRMGMNDKDVVYEFFRVAQVGTVYHRQTQSGKPHYVWICSKHSDIESFFLKLEPWLGKRRRLRGMDLLREYRSRRNMPPIEE